MRKLSCFLTIMLLLVCGLAQAQWVWTPQTGRFINLKKMPKETPELQIEYARSLLMDGNYQKAFRETNKFVEFYGDDVLADENQFLRGEILLARGRRMDAAKAFQQLIAAYPNSDHYEEAVRKQYDIGDYYYDRGLAKSGKKFRLFRNRPYKRAAEVYTMVVDNQPFAPAAAEAQYKIGLCHYARSQYIDAAFEYRRVMEDYAASDWVPDASFGLANCYYKASLPPEYDQAPSEMAIDAIDDFKMRFPNDDRGEELDAIKVDMRESIALQRLQTARFYEQRREYSAAKLYYEILVRDFSDTESAEVASAWLETNEGVVHIGDKYLSGLQAEL